MSEFVSRKTAGALAEAIARWPDWVYGRADRVRLRSGEHGVLAHQIDCLPIPDPQLAFDPGERTERVIGSVRGQIMVPLVFMRKSPRYRVNAATASEHPIPLLTTYETESLLHEMVMQILANSEIPPTSALRDAMQTILGPSGSDHEAHVEKLCATGVWHETRLWAASRRLPSTLVVLMRTLASNTLVIGLIPAGDAGVRQILSLRYSWRVPSPSLMERLRAGLVSTGISHLELRVPLHMSSATRSHILEFRAPWQLTVERILITGDADDFSRRNKGSVGSASRVDAQYLSAPGSYARVHLRVPLRGLRATALLSSGVTLCMAAVCVAMGFERAPLSEPAIALAICAGLVFCMLVTAPLIYRVKKRKYSGLSV